MSDGGWREENMDLHEEIRELEAEIERLRGELLERNAQLLRANDEIERLRIQLGAKPGQYDYAELDTRWQKLVKRNDEQREEIERLRKVVDVAVRRIASNNPPWFFQTEVRIRRLPEDVERQLYSDALRELEESCEDE